MAQINTSSVTLTPFVSAGLPSIIPSSTDINFVTPAIFATGSADLSGAPGEAVARCRLGFAQLEFIETNYAIYRGRGTADGSARRSCRYMPLCRDTHPHAPSIYYDPPVLGLYPSLLIGSSFHRGTSTIPAGSVLPTLPMRSGFEDSPNQNYPVKIHNPHTHQDNFIYHVEIAFHFCTMLVAEYPPSHYHFLKHFYWNVRWEWYFHPDSAGNPIVSRIQHHELNLQNHVHSGLPNDHRFIGQVRNVSLPICTVLANRPRINQYSNSWLPNYVY